jgi:hypothetical protein
VISVIRRRVIGWPIFVLPVQIWPTDIAGFRLTAGMVVFLKNPAADLRRHSTPHLQV